MKFSNQQKVIFALAFALTVNILWPFLVDFDRTETSQPIVVETFLFGMLLLAGWVAGYVAASFYGEDRL